MPPDPVSNAGAAPDSKLPEFLGFVFLEILAAPPAYDGWQALKAGKVLTAAGLYTVAAVPCVVGILVLSGAWARTRTWLSAWLSDRIGPVARDSRWWMVLFILIFAYIGTPVLIGQLKAELLQSAVSLNPVQTVYRTATASPNPNPNQRRELSLSQVLNLAVAFSQVREVFRSVFAAEPNKPIHYDAERIEGCRIFVTSTTSNGDFRGQLEEIAQQMGCQLQPPPQPDADATPIPTPPTHPFVVVRAIRGASHGPPPPGGPFSGAGLLWRRDIAASRSANILVEALRPLGLDVRRSYKIRPDEDETMIYIELGDHSPWKP
jgi:hypothetical protein